MTVYTGPETECVVDRLSPGTAYEVRVCCEGAGGVSDFSDSLIVPTEATCPGQCAPPRLHGKPRPYSVSLKWSKYFSTNIGPVGFSKVLSCTFTKVLLDSFISLRLNWVLETFYSPKEHRASTSPLQSTLFGTVILASLHALPGRRNSRSTARLLVALGLPLLLCRGRFQSKAIFTTAPSSFLRLLYIHFHFISFIFFKIGGHSLNFILKRK